MSNLLSSNLLRNFIKIIFQVSICKLVFPSIKMAETFPIYFRMHPQNHGDEQNFPFIAKTTDDFNQLVACAVSSYKKFNRRESHHSLPYMIDDNGVRKWLQGTIVRTTCGQLRDLAGKLGMSTCPVTVHIDMIV